MTTRRATFPLLALLPVLLLGALAPAPASAGADDFEFAMELAAKGRALGDPAWFDYAERVLGGMIEDGNQVDLAKYGLATLRREEALAAASRDDVPYADVHDLFLEAVKGIERFADNNPDHPKAREAKLDVGTTRLAFVQWARDILGDRDRLAERGADEATVQSQARDMVQKAIRYFDALDDRWDRMAETEEEAKEIEFAQLARYYWVVCRYYSALVHTPCSDEAVQALESAGYDLDEFIGYFDGMLVAVYAQDFYGLTYWELARCARTEEEQAEHYRNAVMWFETCILTEHVDLDTLRIIGRGYYHIAQCCLDAGRVGGENFYKTGASFLRKMLSKVPTVNTTDDGIKAMIEWAKLEYELDNGPKAIEILAEAGEKAEDTGRPWLARRANAEITRMLARGTGGGGASQEPDVLKRVADDQYASGNYRSAIGAYQKVIAACSDSTEDLMDFEVPAWERISSAYKELGDTLSAALATFPIHNAWVDGRIPYKEGDPNDANLLRMGNIRLRAQRELRTLVDETGSPVYSKMWREISDNFKADYPEHPSAELGELKKANRFYDEADELKNQNDSRWKGKLREAIAVYEEISKDPDSPGREYALVRLIRCENMKDDARGMVERANEALAYWTTPEVQEQMKEHETIAGRVEKHRGLATYWKAVALLELEEYDQVIELLKDFGVEHPKVTNEFIQADVLGMLVLSYVNKKDIDTADNYLRRLLQAYPKYPRLPKITIELAKFYDDRYTAIEAKYKAAVARKHGPKGARDEGLVDRLGQAEREENFIAERLVDLNGERANLERLLTTWEEAVARAEAENRNVEDIVANVTEQDVEIARAKIEGREDPPEGVKEEEWVDKYVRGLDATIAANNERLKEAKAKREKLESALIAVNNEIEQYKAEMYPPLVRAANYYYDWLQVLIANGETPSARNLEIFGYRFYYATVLNPDDPETWQKAREIYEMYRDLPNLTPEQRSEVAAKLGRIYSHLSEVAEDEKTKRDYVLQAVDLLQGALAEQPENTELLVGLLTGDYVVIPFRSPLDFKTYRIPIRRVKDVADFRQAADDLLTEAAPTPTFPSRREQQGFENAVREFQKDIRDMKDKALQRTVEAFETAGLDAAFYREHGNTDTDFRLALARVYAQSGRPGDARKALSLCSTLLDSRLLGVEENSEEYWESQSIKFAAYAKAAEVGLAGANTKADAKAMLERASLSLKALYSQNPSLGKDERPETVEELQELLAKINVLRQRAGMSPLQLVLTPKDLIEGAGGAGAGDEDGASETEDASGR